MHRLLTALLLLLLLAGATSAPEALAKSAGGEGELSLSPLPVAAGQAATLSGRLRLRRAATVAIAAEVRDVAGSVAFSTEWPARRLERGEWLELTAEWPVPAGQPTGPYALRLQAVDESGRALHGLELGFDIVAGPAADPAAPDAEEAALLTMLNEHRQANGLAPLAPHIVLGTAADWLSADMATTGYVGHTDSLGRDIVKRLADFGYGGNTWTGETIAAGQPTAAAAFAAWRASPAHAAILLGPDFKSVGLGRVYRPGSPYGTYWTLDLGGE